VVYGDTDSLFVYLPGKSKDDAFRIGNEMADTVTSLNPRPIKLKFEKVGLLPRRWRSNPQRNSFEPHA
jgi:DNA polymerase zeta